MAPRLLLAPHRRHHAIGAAFVAAVDHVHPAADAAVAASGGDVFKDVVLTGGHHLLALLHLGQQHIKPVGVLGPHHQIQLGYAPQQRFPLLLGHAARHHQGEVGIDPFALGLAAQVAVHLLFGVVADRAGVVEHQIGAVLVVAGPIAHGFQDPGHALGIRLVHLAAEGGDPVAASLGGWAGGAERDGRHLTSFSHRLPRLGWELGG
jgi:hypothetical protein